MPGDTVHVGSNLTITDVVRVARGRAPVGLDAAAVARIEKARRFVEDLSERGVVAYGVTTGVGKLSDVAISAGYTEELQRNLLRSHACAVGDRLRDDVVRATCLLRANALARGHSGVRLSVVEMLIKLLNTGVIPFIPEQGSLGASGDLAPLAHLALVLIGEGEAIVGGRRLPGSEALTEAGLQPLTLQAKEGLALINGTQVMGAIGALAVFDSSNLAATADAAGALTAEALRFIPAAFDPRIQAVRGHPGQIETARRLLVLLEGSGLVTSPGELRVQDAYSGRCMPQVHGASRDAFAHVADVISREINAATDNPLLFPDDEEVLSGGNFHGQPLALALDYLSIAAAELASISERRVERLVNPALSGLPAFLTLQAGLHSGLMIAQYTAASLVSENKTMAFPASVDSIPSSANQEDHVSMGTTSARKAMRIITNVWHVLAIELLCAAQALEFAPHKRLGHGTRIVYDFVRSHSPAVMDDRSLSREIGDLAAMLADGALSGLLQPVVGPE